MKINSIDTENIIPVEYSHTHDSKILFRKYRENFDFGLTVDQYYFNQDVKDKKTNYNTQYTLTDLHPLSTIAELDIPFTKDVVDTFSSTIQNDGKYLKNNYSNKDAASGVSATFVAATEFTNTVGDELGADGGNNTTAVGNLSSQFLYTFTLTSVSADNIQGTEDRVIVSQEYDSVTWYLQAINGHSTADRLTIPWTSDGPAGCYFRYALEDNKISLLNPTNAGRVCNALDNLSV